MNSHLDPYHPHYQHPPPPRDSPRGGPPSFSARGILPPQREIREQPHWGPDTSPEPEPERNEPRRRKKTKSRKPRAPSPPELRLVPEYEEPISDTGTPEPEYPRDSARSLFPSDVGVQRVRGHGSRRRDRYAEPDSPGEPQFLEHLEQDYIVEEVHSDAHSFGNENFSRSPRRHKTKRETRSRDHLQTLLETQQFEEDGLQMPDEQDWIPANVSRESFHRNFPVPAKHPRSRLTDPGTSITGWSG